MSTYFLLVLFPVPSFLCPPLLAGVSPPSASHDTRLYFSFPSAHVTPAPTTRRRPAQDLWALPDSLAPVSLVGSHRCGCWAEGERGTLQVLPPLTVTVCAASALLPAPCNPVISSSFFCSFSLGCGQTQRVSGSRGSPEPLSSPCQRISHSQATRPLSPA